MGGCEDWRRTGMAVKHTPILYGGDISLSAYKKKKNLIFYIS